MQAFLESLKKDNPIKRRIFLRLLKNGQSSIPDLAKEMNCSIPTVTKYIASLCEEGFLCDCGKVESKEGRHPNLYGVVAVACYYIGVDIRWFSLSIGIINLTGELLHYTLDESFVFHNTPETLDYICDRIQRYIQEVSEDKTLLIQRKKILGINVNVSGRVNPQLGYSYSILNFAESPLADILTDRIGINTTIDNDTRAMAVGEYALVYEGKVNNLIFINLGWGLGASMVFDGKIYYGKSGFSGEFGHMNVFDNEIMCHCGKKGCLETEVSGLALVRTVVERIQSGSQSILSARVAQGQTLSIYDILDAIMDKDDTLCIEAIEEIGLKLGREIANLINLFNPDTIVIGGLLARTEDYLLLPVKGAVKKHSLNIMSKDTHIVLSKIKEKAGVVGACLTARDRNY
jgi:predicted NBD/HSP70 family sugar kinase